MRKLILDCDRRSDGRYLEIGATSGPEGRHWTAGATDLWFWSACSGNALYPCARAQLRSAMRSEQSDWPAAWPRPYGLEPAPARTSAVKAAVVNGSDVPPGPERAVVCSGGRIVRNRLITAPGSDPAAASRLTYELRLSTVVILKRPAPQPAAGDSCGPSSTTTPFTSLVSAPEWISQSRRHAVHPAPNFTHALAPSGVNVRAWLRCDSTTRSTAATELVDNAPTQLRRAPERPAHFGHRMNRGGYQISPPKLGGRSNDSLGQVSVFKGHHLPS